MSNTDTPTFPDIVGSCMTFKRGMSMMLVGIGRVDVTQREWTSSRRFVRAVYRQTGHQIPMIAERAWRCGDWLLEHLSVCKERTNKAAP